MKKFGCCCAVVRCNVGSHRNLSVNLAYRDAEHQLPGLFRRQPTAIARLLMLNTTQWPRLRLAGTLMIKLSHRGDPTRFRTAGSAFNQAQLHTLVC